MNSSIKSERLGKQLKSMGKVMIAFSGGVDSTVLLKRAQQELGNNALAVIVNSELFRDSEFKAAAKTAEDIGANFYTTEIKELENPHISSNTPDSWYYSKKMLYTHLRKIAEDFQYPYVLDGMIMDDNNDFRPGLKARSEEGIRSLLQENEFYKNEVRDLAKKLNLNVWNKLASCSLASRFPYGTKLNKFMINKVNQAEIYLKEIGFDEVRVRYHDNIARIEVSPEKIKKLLNYNNEIHQKLCELGFDYVSVDLQGYRVGSMNEVLSENYTNEKQMVSNY